MPAYSRTLLPWDSQPQEAVDLDRANPLVQGIVMHVPFHPSWGMRDIVRGNPVTATGLASTNTSSRGISPLFGTSNFADLTDTTGMANLTDPVTIAWVQKFVSPVSNNTVLMWKPLAAPRTALIGYQGTSSAYRFSFGTSVNEWNLSSVASPVDGVERVCVLVCRGGLESATAGDFSVFIDGVDQGTPAGTTFGANTTAGMRVGATLAGGDPFEGGISRLTIWNRPLLEREALGWSESPGSIYLPRSIWVPVSANGATTHATTGALTGAGSTVAGSAARTRVHPSSGALIGPGAVVDGAAARTGSATEHATTGALVGPGAAIDGTAAHIAIHGTSGALTGQGAVIAGTAARVAGAVTHETSGVLVGPGSLLDGAARGPSNGVGGGGSQRKKVLKDIKRLNELILRREAEAPIITIQPYDETDDEEALMLLF